VLHAKVNIPGLPLVCNIVSSSRISAMVFGNEERVMFMKKMLFGLSAVCLSMGCITSVRHISTASGDYYTLITCKESQSNCLKRADDECPNGYEEISNSEYDFVRPVDLVPEIIHKYYGELRVRCK
jgi:hypothetical protein